MNLTDVSYDRIREASLTELYHISEQAGIGDDDDDNGRLRRSEDLRERLILMKRKLEGCSNTWKPLFKLVQGETKVKIDSLVHLMKTVEDTFQTIPTESLSEILRKEGHLQGRNLLEEISTRIRNLKERRSLVVVAGETNGGKSTFLNLLLGEDILPTCVLHCTFAVCKIVYSDVYSIKILDKDDIEEYFPCCSREEVQAILRNKVTRLDTKERELQPSIKEITLGLPAEILKSGVVLVDTPGIGENEAMDNVTMNFVKSTHASAFIYIIKSDTAGGVQEDRLISFLRAIKDRYTSDAMMEAFDPRAAMFVCHRWDNIEERHREKVKQNALSKLEYVWPGFDVSQTFFFSTTDTMKHLPVDPDFITDSFMVLLKGLKQLFDRACHNAIKHQYMWLKYMLHPASRHLKSMITHCIMSNEELEDYFRSVALKQNTLMISSLENSRRLQMELDKMSLELRSLISIHLNFDSISARLQMENYEEMIQSCSKENFFASQANRRALDEMIAHNLLKHIDDSAHLYEAIREMESRILQDIQDHLGLFKCQVSQIKHCMLHGFSPRVSPSQSFARLEDSSNQLRNSTESIHSVELNSSTLDAFQGIHTQGPSQLSETVKSLLTRRKEGKSTRGKTANYQHDVRQSLLGKIGDRIKHAVFHRADPAAYVEERIQKVARDIREDAQIMDIIVSGHTEWIQQCMTCSVNSIPKFIEVNTKLMEEIRDHRTTFQRYKDVFVRVMENLEPCRHNLRGYGLLYMDDINAETLAFNTEHRTSTVSLPKYLYTTSGRSIEAGPQDSSHGCLWSRMEAATIEIDNVGSRVVIKTYTHDLDERVILPEIASLRFLDYTNIAPFLGMTRIAARSSGKNASYLDEREDVLTQKVSAFIFRGDLVSARVYSRRKADMQTFIPEMVQSLLRGLNYIHREGLVHMELNLKTVMVEKGTGTVKLCHMCKPREATFPEDLNTPTHSYVCLSPSVLEGNVYESTDDIYAFGLLLWELLFPRKPPFTEQRLWKLEKFIEKCHPTSMLQKDMSDLRVSDCVMDVLKGTLLISRGHVFMSVATIQSKLSDLHNEPTVLSMESRQNLPDYSLSNSIILSAPDIEVISPSGTAEKLEFTYDNLLATPNGSSLLAPEPTIRKNYSSGKLSSINEENIDKDKNGNLAPITSKRSTSEPDVNKPGISTTKPKKKHIQFLNKLLKIFPSSKKAQGEELKPSAVSDSASKHSVQIPDKKQGSTELEIAPTQLRGKNQFKETAKEKRPGPMHHDKHKSLPNTKFFGSGSGLSRKDSIDVPTLMSTKFRQSLGNKRLPGLDTSRLHPLSSLKYDNSQSGSMPSLQCLDESTEHKNTEHPQTHNSARQLASSYNPRPPTPNSSSSNSRTNGLFVSQNSPSTLTQPLRFGGSLYDMSDKSLNHTIDSNKYNSNSKVGTLDQSEKYVERTLFRTNHVVSSRKRIQRHVSHPSPLAMIKQSVSPMALNTSSVSITDPQNVAVVETKSEIMAVAETKSEIMAVAETKSEIMVVADTKSENMAVVATKSENMAVAESKSGNMAVAETKSENTNMGVAETKSENIAVAETKSIPLLSSSTSSRDADSGFSTDTSGQGVKDLVSSHDDMQPTLASFSNISTAVNYFLNDNDNMNDSFSSSQSVHTSNFITNDGEINQRKGNSSRDNTDNDMGNDTGSSSGINFLVNNCTYDNESNEENKSNRSNDLSLQLLSQDSEGTLSNKGCSERSETICDSGSDSSIPPPPPPINFAELTFSFSGYDDDDSDE